MVTKSNNKLLVYLLIALAVAVCAYFYFKKQEGKKVADPAPAPPLSPGPVRVGEPVTGTIPQAPVITLPAGKFPLKYGSRGKAIQFMQVIVGQKPDGIWGPATDVAMRRFFTIVKNADQEITTVEFIEYVLLASGAEKWPLQRGSSGNYVKALQIMLGLTIDGKFGTATASRCTSKFGRPNCTLADFQTLVKEMINT